MWKIWQAERDCATANENRGRKLVFVSQNNTILLARLGGNVLAGVVTLSDHHHGDEGSSSSSSTKLVAKTD